MSAASDPSLDLPLEGRCLIEASAGTGKTFILATLVTRLVVERGLRLGQILAVTFTDAATQELRKRIRERLALAARLVPLAAPEGVLPAALEADTSVLPASDALLTRTLLRRHLLQSGETPARLCQRLQQAAEESDLAAVFTIHGFCARVLREHVLESGQTCAPPALLANDRELLEELAADLWRLHAADADTAEHLPALWPGGPPALAHDLRALIATAPPPLDDPGVDPRPQLQQAAQCLCAAIASELETARAAVDAAFAHNVFDGRRARRRSFDTAFQTLLDGATVQVWPRAEDAHLDKLRPAQLLALCKNGQQAAVPRSPLFDALANWMETDDRLCQWQASHRLAWLHGLRDQARARLAARKRQRRVQTYDDLIDGVAEALAGPHQNALAQRLREQYAVALLDEFQDTDARQWCIFHRLFGDAPLLRTQGLTPALFLIGDPKQAIYGFRGGDVQTYLAAARTATRAPALERNFRSRPALLTAIAALYAQAGPEAFREPEIGFHPVHPGGTRSDADYTMDGACAPALTVWSAPDPGQGQAYSVEASRALAAAACVAEIHRVLAAARAGRAWIADRPVQPGDIAVLVRQHREAIQIRQALAQAGIAAVAAGKQSLFATPEAQEILRVLLALLHATDDGWLRAALATVLLGVDAAGIAALEQDGQHHREWQLRILGWRDRLQRAGPMAMLADLCADQAERLLGLLDGERRLTNYLQLGELLQQTSARALGLHGLADWLARQIAVADDSDETQLLRLESDACRVQILTLHKSKGLEYPLVFLPFMGIGGKSGTPERHCIVQEDGVRVLHWKLDPGQLRWKQAVQAVRRAEHAEHARLLYVGLTRAEQALWIACGPFYNAAAAPLAPMLRDLEALARQPGIVVERQPVPVPPPRLPPTSAETVVPPARQARRALNSDWWIYSFTQLTHVGGGQDGNAHTAERLPGGQDEPSAMARIDSAEPVDSRFAGQRFGVILHAALERTDFAAWTAWHADSPAPASEQAVIAEALCAGGISAQEMDDGAALLTRLIGQALTVVLPEGGRLCDLPAAERRAEIEFQFALCPTRIDALLRLLHAHGVVRERQGFGQRWQLDGLITGMIDLTYCSGGRWYLLDYKSNRLSGYGPAQLAQAMAHGEYDLQALIYTLALHRWLRFRLGEAYGYARDFGGVRYLFCRGLDAVDPQSPGVYAHRFAPALITALDALFAGRAEGTEVVADTGTAA